jgi:hypothetical protein
LNFDNWWVHCCKLDRHVEAQLLYGDNQASIAVPDLCMFFYFSLEERLASIDNDMKDYSGLQFAYGYTPSDPAGTKENARTGAIHGYRGGHL